MHIITGLAIAALFGQKERSHASPPSVFGVLEVVHCLPNRIRLASPILESAPEDVAKELAKQLTAIPGVESASVTQASGSVLVVFDGDLVSPHVVHSIVVRLLGLEEDMAKPPKGKLIAEIKDMATAASQQVHQASRGLLDLPTSVMLCLAAVALYRIGVLGDRTIPSGATLLWWASMLASKQA